MTQLIVLALFIAGVIAFVWYKLPQYRGWLTAAALAIGTAFGAAWEWIAGLFGGQPPPI